MVLQEHQQFWSSLLTNGLPHHQYCRPDENEQNEGIVLNHFWQLIATDGDGEQDGGEGIVLLDRIRS